MRIDSKTTYQNKETPCCNKKKLARGNFAGQKFITGFTLIELLVSASIFTVIVTLSLALFSQILKIQRRVEATRLANQALRSISEFLVKEIRNSKIHYGIEGGASLTSPFFTTTNCPKPPQSGGAPTGGATYAWNSSLANQGLNLIKNDGLECIYYDSTTKAIYLEKLGGVGQKLTPNNVSVDRFEVRVIPGKDPYMSTGGLAEIQPMAQFLITLKATLPSGEIKSLNYQTSVSTNIYDIPQE